MSVAPSSSSHVAGGDRDPRSTEEALAMALERATRAGQWDVVRLLARELEARRHKAAGNVVPISAASRNRKPSDRP